MKKIIFGMLTLFALIGSVSVNAQDSTTTTTTTTTRVKYWYYPSANVYYNDVSGDYYYYDEPSTTWMISKKLPTTYTIATDAPKYEVWYNGTDVWKDNPMHLKKYKMRKNGKAKIKDK